MKQRIAFAVFTVSPDDLRRKFTRENYVPCHYVDGVLYLAGTKRSNGIDVAHYFLTRQEAKNAIKRTMNYCKRESITWWGDYKIIPFKLFVPKPKNT